MKAEYLVAKGVIVVAASGNDNKAYLASPANSESTIGVGGFICDPNTSGTYGEYGEVYSAGNRGNGLDVLGPCYISAPQKGTTNGYTEFGGTSSATPFVAGMVALWLDKNPSLVNDNDGDGNQDIKQLMMASAEDTTGDSVPGWDSTHGAGKVSMTTQNSFYYTDVSYSMSSAPQVFRIYSGSKSYARNNEPLWPVESGGCDYYEVFVSKENLVVPITANVICDPDLSVQMKILDRYGNTLKSTTIAAGETGSLTYTHTSELRAYYYVFVKATSNTDEGDYWGDWYDINIHATVTSSGGGSPKPPPEPLFIPSPLVTSVFL
jgi:subtilisin family serine protease